MKIILDGLLHSPSPPPQKKMFNITNLLNWLIWGYTTRSSMMQPFKAAPAPPPRPPINRKSEEILIDRWQERRDGNII